MMLSNLSSERSMSNGYQNSGPSFCHTTESPATKLEDRVCVHPSSSIKVHCNGLRKGKYETS